jgi:NAD(P)-dependent dehydrogenase (short-subunit alcohol dehydrogenase family)
MGQVNLVRSGFRYINGSGSFKLISSMLAVDPMPGSAAVSLDNAGLNGFVRAAALEFPRGVRINALSPPWVRETLAVIGQDESQEMPATQVGGAYIESIEGQRAGKMLPAQDFVGKAQ